MFAFFIFSSIFSMVSSNCVELYVTGEYWVKGWVVEANTTIHVDGTTVTMERPFVSYSEFFLNKDHRVIVGNGNVTTCNDETCPVSVENDTYFFEIHFSYFRNGLDNDPIPINSKLLLAVVDSGIISFAKGNIIEHRKTYHGSHTRKLSF